MRRTKLSNGPEWLIAGAMAAALIGALLLAVPRVSGNAQGQLTVQPVKDSYVASGLPNQSWPLFRTLWIGRDQSAGYGIQRTLLQFALAGLPPGSQIQSATLRLYLSGTTQGDAPMSVQIRRIANNWNENVSWNQYVTLPVDASPTAAAEVATELGWIQWDVTAIVQEWLYDPQGGSALSLVLNGNEADGQHERVFWSRNCSDADCGPQPGKRPVLEIFYTTPTATPTATRTPTSTPSPTPGLKTLVLRNSPATAIEPGEEILYTVEYRNGPQPLIDFGISNEIPLGAEYVTGSATNGGFLSNESVQWSFGALAGNAAGNVSYRVRRSLTTGTATPTPTNTATATPTGSPEIAFSLVNQPSTAQPMVGEQYGYDVIITNESPSQILDRIELTDSYNPDPVRQCVVAVSATNGSCSLNATQEQWNCDYPVYLASGQSGAVRFTFLAADTCSDTLNGNTAMVVVHAGGATSQAQSATARVPITTLLTEKAGRPLPATLPDVDPIVNRGAVANWLVNGQPDTMRSNVANNPTNARWLPAVRRR